MRLYYLRHSYASHAVHQGVPLPVISRLLGLKRPSMTLRYAHVGDRNIETAAERIGLTIALALAGRETTLTATTSSTPARRSLKAITVFMSSPNRAYPVSTDTHHT